ncbi:cyclic AMP-dependent transcription factor ATF-4 [Gouania willdenowi]|uniref:cyclic AMP-dependent transcription factor ATF-4 n=1 Tax=Gouania willdenowi TaxID=441366 RepID=UPI0010569453|nr:cyclic AMP-dependent transcription factor ATF-4-like [Gouania willdenowi]
MTLFQFALKDVAALCLEPLFLMADPVRPLLDQDDDEAAFIPFSSSSPSSSPGGEAPASPSESLSSTALSPSLYKNTSLFKPLPLAQSSSSFRGTKADSDPLSPSWLTASSDVDKWSDYDAAMDWMSEKMDLSEFDLDSLIGSCSSDEVPSSPEELLASLNSQMSLDLDDFSTTIPAQYSVSLDLSLADVPLSLEPSEGVEPPQELVKSEPPSPVPLSPSYTIEVGSEVDVLDGNVPTVTPIVLSIPADGRLPVVLTNEEEIKSDSDTDSGISSPPHLLSSPPSTPPPVTGSSRTKPYSKPEPVATPTPRISKVKSVSGTPKVVEKKVKKMEQNKTAATRYRQKKRVEHEQLGTELEELQKKNQELTEKAGSISREIQYLKDLMEEVRKHHRGKNSSMM